MTRQKGAARPTPAGRLAIAALVLAAVALLAAAGSLWMGLSRGTAREDCGSLAWGAIPATTQLPTGWHLLSNRFFVDNSTTTLVGPAPSGGTEGTAVYISASCYGADAEEALARAHQAALAAGGKDLPVRALGEESFAVTNQATGTTVFVRRGHLVADLTAPPSVDETTLEALLFALDSALKDAIATGGGSPPASFSPPPSAPAPTAASPSPSVSPSPVSHAAPDLEARLPRVISGTTLSTESVTGATALGSDATSKALAASLAKLGKQPADLLVARASDRTNKLAIRIIAFQAPGVASTDLRKTLADALLADTTAKPTASEATVGGRRVTKLTYPTGPTEYLYEGADGVVFDVETTEEALAAEAIGAVR